jgi:hypothetical protein
MFKIGFGEIFLALLVGCCFLTPYTQALRCYSSISYYNQVNYGYNPSVDRTTVGPVTCSSVVAYGYCGVIYLSLFLKPVSAASISGHLSIFQVCHYLSNASKLHASLLVRLYDHGSC